MSSRCELSLIITFHREGYYAYKTIRCIELSLPKLSNYKGKYELIFHLDKPDPLTRKIVTREAGRLQANLFENNFGDIGQSRNFAIKKARGEYVSLLDGDDLVSDNWIKESFELVKANRDCILVHPEANLTFGANLKQQVLWVQKDSLEKWVDALISVFANRWISTVTGRREIFLNYPYFKSENGFGNEDHWFNTETLARGIKHLVAKKTVMFYRRKSTNSVYEKNLYKVQPYSRLLDIEYFRDVVAEKDLFSAEGITDKNVENRVYSLLQKSYKKFTKNTTLRNIMGPIAYRFTRYVKRGGRKAPNFVIQEWIRANKIDASLYPTKAALHELAHYSSEMAFWLGKKYLDLIKGVSKMPDYVFIVPWVMPGGADKVLINYLEAIKELFPERTIAVITTLPSENAWAKRLPDNSYIIDFGNIGNGMPEWEKDILFSRIIIQLQCKKIHIINSEYGYSWVSKHLDLIQGNNFILNASLFCHDIIGGTRGQGVFDYADPYLLDIFPAVKTVFTDNKAVIDRVAKLDGFDKEKFKVEYQPVGINVHDPVKRKFDEGGRCRILWASRIAAQKNPELLKEIGRRLDPEKFQIDVYGRMERGYSESFFADVPSIEYRGTFNGIESLDTSKYDLFLYTSLIDGLPNILLEMIALGLPIVATSVGGVGEVIIDKKTGRLISGVNPNSYVEAILELVSDSNASFKYVKAAQKLLESQHSEEQYLRRIAKDFQ